MLPARNTRSALAVLVGVGVAALRRQSLLNSFEEHDATLLRHDRVGSLHPDGRALLAKGLVSDAECDHLQMLANRSGYRPSTVQETQRVTVEVRAASTAYLLTGFWRTSVQAAVATRLIRAFSLLPSEMHRVRFGGEALSVANLEDFQSARYEEGEGYHMHVDGSGPAECSASSAACSSAVDGEGCRMVTALIYCSTLRREDGGATLFHFDDGSSARVVPKRGNVALFPADSWHASETLLRGEKVVFNVWALCRPEPAWSYYIAGAIDGLVDAVGRDRLEQLLDADLPPLRKL